MPNSTDASMLTLAPMFANITTSEHHKPIGLRNEIAHTRAWIKRQRAQSAEPHGTEVMRHIISQWPALNAAEHAYIYHGSIT